MLLNTTNSKQNKESGELNMGQNIGQSVEQGQETTIGVGGHEAQVERLYKRQGIEMRYPKKIPERDREWYKYNTPTRITYVVKKWRWTDMY